MKDCQMRVIRGACRNFEKGFPLQLSDLENHQKILFRTILQVYYHTRKLLLFKIKVSCFKIESSFWKPIGQ